MPRIVLYGGECDGFEEQFSFTERPEIFYAVPLSEYDLIRGVKDNLARVAAMESHRSLAYVFWKLVSTDDRLEFRYRRDSTQDKPPVIPVASGENG